MMPMPQKSKLGQNFLRDQMAIQRIVASLGDLSHRTVVEIGPGKGAITELLAPRAAHLIAIELDPALASDLESQFQSAPNVSIQRQDVLAFDFAAAARAAGHPLLVIGNLPYYITSPILSRLANFAAAIDLAILMVQREVADRITAQPHSRDYGLLTVTTQIYGPATSLFTLPPTAFVPPPEVHSTVFRWAFRPRFDELQVQERPFLALLKQCFAQKRKTLSNNLRAAGHHPATIAPALAQANIAPHSRAEELTLEQFAALQQSLLPKS